MHKNIFLLFLLAVVVVPVALMCMDMDQQEQQICNYCREPASQQFGQLEALKCYKTHTFHKECLSAALNFRPNRCPTCFKPIDPSKPLPQPTPIRMSGLPLQNEDYERLYRQDWIIGSTVFLCLFGFTAVNETYFKHY